MVDKNVSWVTPDGTSNGVSKYKSNGSASVKVSAPNTFKDTGTWRIDGNEFCTKYKALRKGAESCSTIRTTSQDGVYRMDTVFIRAK